MGWVGEQHTHQRGVTGKRERPADSTETLKMKNEKYSLAVTQDRETGFSAVNSSKLPHQLMRLDSILTSQNKMAAEDQYLLL
jgi:hypothetical protein